MSIMCDNRKGMFSKLRFFALLIPLICTLLPQPAAAFEQAVQPQQGPPGTLFAFFATGFNAKEWVYLWANDPNGKVYEAGATRTNDLNRADWTWASPGQAPFGTWTMVAHGSKSNIERVISFQIGNVQPNQTSLLPAGQEDDDQAISPREGAPGTAFLIFAKGFRKYERVVFRAYAPDGSGQEIGAFGTNEYGRVDWTWKSSSSLLSGLWKIVAKGDISHVERVITVSILGESFPEQAHARDSYDKAVTPGRGAPGTTFRFFASNFAEGESITYQIIAPDGQLFVEDESNTHYWSGNRADWRWKSPYNAPTGTWTVIAEGNDSHIRETFHFEVGIVETQPNVPTRRLSYDSAVFPAEGKPGTTFAFFAIGYGSKEQVDYQCITPHGVIFFRGSKRSSEFGRADWECFSPYNGEAGVWTSIATGRKTHVQTTIQFTLVP